MEWMVARGELRSHLEQIRVFFLRGFKFKDGFIILQALCITAPSSCHMHIQHTYTHTF